MKSSLIVLGIMLVTVAACASSDKPKHLCPQTAIIRDLERIKDYGGDVPDDKTLVAEALMHKVEGKCRYGDEGVDLDLTLQMKAGRGSGLGGDRVSFPYFVAVLDPEQKILSREQLTAEFRFSGDQKITDMEEPLHIFIPTEKDADASYYQVLAGFQITQEQLEALRNKNTGGMGK